MVGAVAPLLAEVFVYPIKGLSPRRMGQVQANPNFGLRGDRQFALFYSPSEPARRSLAWQEKNHFLEQNDWPGLAAYRSEVDLPSGTLSVEKDGRSLLRASFQTDSGLRAIDQFFSQLLTGLTPMKQAQSHQVPPVWWVGSDDSRYPDRINQNVSLLNRESLRDLEKALGRTVEMERFRGNLILDQVPAWSEETWSGKIIEVGEVTLQITKSIGRCNNVNVNPATGVVDSALLTELAGYRKKANFGILATVLKGGLLTEDSRLRFLS